MPKARFTSLDLRCIVRDIQSKLQGLRVANVYDLNTKTYLFKLAKPDSKLFLVIESGVRIHSTTFTREHKDVPSVFTLKLRQAIRARRLENIVQYGFDRVIDMTFGSGEHEHHVICEFYAGGNIVLTNANYKIIALLRTYKSEDGAMNIAVGETYPTQALQKLQLPTKEQIETAVSTAKPNTPVRDILASLFVIGTEMIDHCLASCDIPIKIKTASYQNDWTSNILSKFESVLEFAEAPQTSPGYVLYTNKQDRDAAESSRAQAAAAVTAQKAAKKKGPKKGKGQATSSESTDPSTDPEPTEIPESSNTPTQQTTYTIPAEELLVTIDKMGDAADCLYENFVPFKFAQNANIRHIEFPDFDRAADEYYSKIEGQKVEAHRAEQEGTFVKRLDKVREENAKRVQALVDAEEKSRFIASLITKNAELVDVVIRTINSYLATQITWQALSDLVKQEQKKGSPVALCIHKLKLETNSVILMLYMPDEETEQVEEEEDEEDETEDLFDSDEDVSEDEASRDNRYSGHTRTASKKSNKKDKLAVADAELVEIDLALNSHKNAENYFAATKKAAEKKQKTIDASKQALKRAEKKVKADMKTVKVKASIQRLRSPYWFEKFNWFITSDGFIVVSGRDMQQNELLYKRYLVKGDVYVHADVHGASTCVIKNPTNAVIPPRTLNEAGTLSVCYSAAWKNKIVTSAWWVEENQVSKTAPTGEYLSTGSFMIRGKKNFLPPSALIMGMGILFRLADESVASHVNAEKDEDEQIRKEKERRNQERDQLGMLKYGSGVNSSTENATSADASTDPSSSISSTNPESTQPLDEGMHDIEIVPSEYDSDEEDAEFSHEHENEQEDETHDNDEDENEDEEDEEDEEDSQEEEEEEDLKEGETPQAKTTEISSSAFVVDFKTGTVEDEEALLLAEAESLNSATSSSTPSGDKPGPKKYMSKYERKRAKKSAELGVDPSELPKHKPSAQETEKKKPVQPSKAEKEAEQKKKKKIPKKYRHQDEEERQAAMELLASAGKQKLSAKQRRAAAKKGQAGATQESLAANSKAKTDARVKAQKAQLEKEREEEEIRLLLKEEKLELLSPEDMAKLQETSAKGLGVNLSALTGRPRAGDVLLYAMAVCAPYDALKDFKYRVKITPGTLKKGKSSKLAITAFTQQADATERERELIRAIPDAELAMNMIANAKLSKVGLSSIPRK